MQSPHNCTMVNVTVLLVQDTRLAQKLDLMVLLMLLLVVCYYYHKIRSAEILHFGNLYKPRTKLIF